MISVETHAALCRMASTIITTITRKISCLFVIVRVYAFMFLFIIVLSSRL